MTIKAQDFDRLVTTLGYQTRDSGDLLAWFEYEGKVILRTRRSHKRSGDLPFQHAIRQQMKLNESELKQVLSGKLTRTEYVELLKRKGFL